MKMFEDREFKGALAEYLENCKPARIEAIYNYQYRYIKEIIYDKEAQEKYGDTREGYEKFKMESPGNFSYSGELDLRLITDKDGKEIGAFTETKRTNNDNYLILKKQFDDALDKTKEILKVNDSDSFMYWLEEYEGGIFGFLRSGPNETISAIETLEEILVKYTRDENFKKFIDKIKG